ncbi:reverse transcriptase domain-containing protein [Pelodictyon luteolum]|uniref:reverse transcriptase domain-containing protein n=1 Tax=Pelodictyon luteolum TaxID=1100 RepID=UPI0003165F70|nr:reverse transcriptase domain-containing protein [Pelodictyon luteolum]
MVAGGTISPLLLAIYSHPLDKAIEQPEKKGRILYRRFMDDFIILAKSRHTFKSAIRTVHCVQSDLKLTLHPVKRFISRTENGFDFLGYQIHPDRRLRPSATSLHLITEHARRLYEHGASIMRLRQYVTRWHRWLLGGLDKLATTKGSGTRYWIFVLKRLDIPKLFRHP